MHACITNFGDFKLFSQTESVSFEVEKIIQLLINIQIPLRSSRKMINDMICLGESFFFEPSHQMEIFKMHPFIHISPKAQPGMVIVISWKTVSP